MAKSEDEKIAMKNFVATVKHYLKKDHGMNLSTYDRRIEYLYEIGKSLSETIKTLVKEKERKRHWK